MPRHYDVRCSLGIRHMYCPCDIAEERRSMRVLRQKADACFLVQGNATGQGDRDTVVSPNPSDCLVERALFLLNAARSLTGTQC